MPASGGGGPGEVAILSPTGSNPYTLTYTFASAYNLSAIDVFSGWGDNGRFEQNYTVFYSLESLTTFIQLGTAVNYTAGGNFNAEWSNLALLGVNNVAAIEFSFGAQQNGYVGYTELAVLGTPSNPVLTWSGGGGSGGNGSWDTTSSTSNWTSSGSPVAYANSDNVIFDDTGKNTNVTIQSGGVAPGSVTFANNQKPYSFTSAGATGITGNSGVTVSGGGSVTFSSLNTYTGPTTVSDGALQVASTGSIGSGALRVETSGGLSSLVTLGSSQAVGNLSGTVSGAGTATINLPTTGTALTVNESGITAYAGVITGDGGLILSSTSTGTLTLSGYNTFTGGTTVNGGTLALGSGGNGNGALVGTLTINAAATVITVMRDVLGYNSAAASLTTLNINGGSLVLEAGATTRRPPA